MYAQTFSHSFVFPSTTCVIVPYPVLLRLSFYHFISDRKKKKQINALMKKVSYGNI